MVRGGCFETGKKINFQAEVSGAISITIFLLCLLRLLLFQLFMSTWIFSIQTYLNSSWRFMPINWITYAFLYHHFPGSGFLVYTTLFQSQLEDLLTSINLVVTFCIYCGQEVPGYWFLATLLAALNVILSVLLTKWGKTTACLNPLTCQLYFLSTLFDLIIIIYKLGLSRATLEINYRFFL